MTITIDEVLGFVNELVEPTDADFILETLQADPDSDGQLMAPDLTFWLTPASWLIWLRLAHGEKIAAKPTAPLPHLPYAPPPTWVPQPSKFNGFEVWC